jgi:lysozyme
MKTQGWRIQGRLGRSAALAGLCVSLVGGFEGLRTVAYSDPVGIPTICFGETRNVHLGERKTPAECGALLASRLVEFEAGMTACLEPAVPDRTYAALLSFTYNVGVKAFCGSTLVRKANAGDLVGACNELPKWNRAAGIVLPGLTTRRAEERVLCLDGLGAAS